MSPKVICLCGSTRFPEAFKLANMHESLMGNVVVSVGMFGHTDEPAGAKFLTSDGDEQSPVKQNLDRLHYDKINISDEVLVINVGGYIGTSTKREIKYAKEHDIPVRYLFHQWLDPTD